MTADPIYNEPGLYDEILPRYEFGGRPDEDILRSHLAAITNGQPVRCALELGCGTGRMTPVLLDFATTTRCVDSSDVMLRAFRERCPGIEPICADARGFVAEDGDDYSLVVACWSLNYPLLSCFESNTGTEIVQRPHDEALRDARSFLGRLTDKVAPGGSLVALWFDPESVEQRFVTDVWETITPFPGSGRGYTKDLLLKHLHQQPGELTRTHYDGAMVGPSVELALRWFTDGHFKGFPQLADAPIRARTSHFLAGHAQYDGTVRVPTGLDVIMFTRNG